MFVDDNGIDEFEHDVRLSGCAALIITNSSMVSDFLVVLLHDVRFSGFAAFITTNSTTMSDFEVVLL